MKIILHSGVPLVVLLMMEGCSAQTPVRKDPGGVGSTTQVEFYVGEAVDPAPKYHVKSFHKVGPPSVELAGRFRGLAISDIETGEYEYALVPEGARANNGEYELTGKIKLWAPAYWITLQAPDPIGPDLGQLYVTGQLTPLPDSKEPIWIRLQNVTAASQVLQAKVNPDGSFRIPCGLISGNFVVTVCRGSEVLYLNVVRFVRNAPGHLEIKLPQTYRPR